MPTIFSKLKLVCFFLAVFFMITPPAISQNRNAVDSLKSRLEVAADLQKTELLNVLLREYISINLDTALLYGKQAEKIAARVQDSKGMANTALGLGNIYSDIGNYYAALDHYKRGLRIADSIHEKVLVARCAGNLANVYRLMGNYPESLANYFKVLKIFTDLNDVPRTCAAYLGIAEVYRVQKNFKLCLEYYTKVYAIYEKQQDEAGMANLLNSMSVAYFYMQDFDLAIKYAQRSLMLGGNNLRGQANNYQVLASVYSVQKNYGPALSYYLKTLNLSRQINDGAEIAGTLGNIGELYISQSEYKKALPYLEEALAMHKKSGAAESEALEYSKLARVYAGLKNYEKAYAYQLLFTGMNDTLMSIANTKEITQMGAKYQFEMKELQIASLSKDKQILTKDQAISNSELRRQRIYIYAAIVVLLMTACLAFFIFKIYKTKQRAHKLLEEKNAVIEEKNKNITDSINYARRIQNSLITSERYINKHINRLKK